MIVVVDTRERHHAYGFDGFEVVRRKLDAGDYSVAGFERSVSVERKTMDDLVKTVIQDRSRFQRELVKLKTYAAACVVVEGSLADLMAGRYTGSPSPGSVLGAILSIQLDFGVPVVFAGDRQHARLYTERFLERATRRQRANPVNVETAAVEMAVHHG